MQNRNILRWIAAAIITLLAAYLQMTGYLPESGQQTAYENQAAEESEYGAGPENQADMDKARRIRLRREADMKDMEKARRTILRREMNRIRTAC